MASSCFGMGVDVVGTGAAEFVSAGLAGTFPCFVEAVAAEAGCRAGLDGAAVAAGEVFCLASYR